MEILLLWLFPHTFVVNAFFRLYIECNGIRNEYYALHGRMWGGVHQFR